MAKESAAKAAEPVKAPGKIKINIPKRDKNDTQRLLSVNGKSILVQTGVDVWVEPKYAEVFYHSQAMEREQEAYIEKNAIRE